ncbi:MAG: tRNA preQ1(34) S-adenosylmethionine ribosyltransferase-isomerase QueA [Verrucomicrobia bacterium]|nr:tRNA preQ1(34) S-adenosylmethionine ribosyltransferase-isomerase QueA [Verrucomicrobiota bacterium]
MRTQEFDYDLPPELIAHTPAPRRDASRLIVLDRQHGSIAHRRFVDLLDYVREGDVLVLNNSRVIPARLRAIKPTTGGHVELLLLEESSVNDWWVMMKPAKRVRVGAELQICKRCGTPSPVTAVLRERNNEGHCRIEFRATPNIVGELDELGEVPLPPYIPRGDPRDDNEDRVRYQTVFAGPPGSAAAPTAGLHFTPELLDAARMRGARVRFVTLHVGLGTFAPVKAEDLDDHVMHEERFHLGAETAAELNTAKSRGSRIIACGTTSLRVLETIAASLDGPWREQSGRTRLFVRPPFHFRVVDALLTNFHLPRSSLLVLACAFAAPGGHTGRELVMSAYASAIRGRYRFFSYGDAMLIL